MKLAIALRPLLFVLIMYYALPANAISTILVMGDSLSAYHGINISSGWVTLLDKRIKSEGYDYQIVNASTSGATSAQALNMFPGLLKEYKPAIVILAIGSNDGLRGQPVIGLRTNLTKMIEDAEDYKAKVLLIGFKLPYNYGKTYRQQFEQTFTDLSDKFDVPLVPFLLDGFAEDLNFFQEDQVHPTTEAQPLMTDNVWPYLKPLL